MSELYLRNRQRTRPIDTRLLCRIAAALISHTWVGEFRVGVLLVGALEMGRLNKAYLGHSGPTDVLAFRYTPARSRSLHGEVFICVDEALQQARRFIDCCKTSKRKPEI